MSAQSKYENLSTEELCSPPKVHNSSTSCNSCCLSNESAFSRVLISGAGFLADAYDLFVINIAVDLMAQCSYKDALTVSHKSTIKSMALAGSIVGQLGFGSIADLIGRKSVFVATCAIVILGAILSACAVDSGGSFGLFSQVSLWRFWLGVGVGGEYPLSAAVTTESSQKGSEIRNLAMVFSMQGAGTLLCSVVLVLITNFMGDNYDAQWRLALLLGAAPMVAAFYFRWVMHETRWTEEEQRLIKARPTAEIELPRPGFDFKGGGVQSSLTVSTLTDASETPATVSGHLNYNAEPQAHRMAANRLTNSNDLISGSHSVSSGASDQSTFGTLKTYFSEGSKYVLHTVRLNCGRLLGTAGAWFILDVVFYANGLFSGQVSEAMHFAHDPRSEATASMILQAISIPGYFCTILYADRIGLKRLQLYGFAGTALIFLVLATLQSYLQQVPALYVILYGLTFFAQNFGANSTTYIIPSLLFEASHRATCHGISAAAGKLGALLGAQVFLYVVGSFCAGGTCESTSSSADINAGLQLTFACCGLLAVLGYVWTYYLVEDPMMVDPPATPRTNADAALPPESTGECEQAQWRGLELSSMAAAPSAASPDNDNNINSALGAPQGNRVHNPLHVLAPPPAPALSLATTAPHSPYDMKTPVSSSQGYESLEFDSDSEGEHVFSEIVMYALLHENNIV